MSEKMSLGNSSRLVQVCKVDEDRFPLKNTTEGFKSLAAWLESLKIEQVHACLEATGSSGKVNLCDSEKVVDNNLCDVKERIGLLVFGRPFV